MDLGGSHHDGWGHIRATTRCALAAKVCEERCAGRLDDTLADQATVVVVVWREVGEEEEGRGGGLNLEETLRARLSRPFRSAPLLVCHSGALIGPSGCLFWRSPVARGALRTTITGEGGEDSQRVNRIGQACGARCHFLLCAFGPCPLICFCFDLVFKRRGSETTKETSPVLVSL